MYSQTMNSPMGKVTVTADHQGVTSVAFGVAQRAEQPSDVTNSAVSQLTSYFAGSLKHFDLPLSQQGTAFQKQVWSALCEISYGQTASYSDIANRINNPKAVRAVGMANGRNPIAIIVPCHRIIGANGTLTGYAGGIDKKHALLQLEGIDISR